MNHKRIFNDGWEFAKSDLNVTDYTALAFEPVDLPHDWLIYNTLDLYESNIGWYRKTFTWNNDSDHVLLNFDGVYMDSTLFVNDKWAGEWKYGYSSFEHDITDHLIEGENELLVKVVYKSPNSRWYSGAGIYRNVWLKTRNRNHIATNGIYVSTKQTANGWEVDIDTEMSLTCDAQLSHTLKFQNQTLSTATEKVTNTAEFQTHNRQKLVIEHPKTWSPTEPHLYKIETELTLLPSDKSEKQRVELHSQNIGFRTFTLDPNEGFKLNGKKMKLNGVCEHHDLGALGAAFNKTALKRRFTILKDMGVNAIRTAHNMPAKELMELADEMGFLIVSEAFDMWERSKTTYDYARFFKEWVKSDIKSWVMRDRNHPSLLLWSIGNEIYDTHADERGQELTRMLMAEVSKYDPKKNAEITIGSNYMPWENAQKVADLVKIAGYNYAENYYHQHHKTHPDWVIYGSETASTVQSRGIYHFPLEKSILADDDEQCSSLGNSSTSWGAKSTEACLIADRDTPFSLGTFIWTGFDYIGEPTPYHTKNAYFGQIDTATFKKDSYYIYQSEWTDYKTHPMVHILPYWDFNNGQIIDVRVCSNAPKIELQFNGLTVGTHPIDHKNGTKLVGWWKIPYEKGELKALAYDENDHLIATEIKHSFGDAKKIRLTPDKNTLHADGQDLVFVEISMEDDQGHPVENATNRVTVNVSGSGRLVGLDNGDSTDYDQYKGISRRLFSGKLMAIIAAKKEPGTIQMEVTSIGLHSQQVDLEALPVEKATLEGHSPFDTENQAMPILVGTQEEIPVRKIELICESDQSFNETRTEIRVLAKLHPENTSYQEVEWRVVNDSGIDSNIAKVDALGNEAKITALGDGDFRVRCTSKNGTNKTKLISELEFKATGLGTAFKDPYGFISAGLYDYSNGEVTNGNERGVASSRDGETQVGFHEIDFGPYGSDTITLPIFALSSAPYSLQIWEGMPGESGSECIGDVIYQKESRWNVYQEETYRLTKRLRGVTSICFILRDKVHIKGFSFERKNRAFEQNFASDCDAIYGDNFLISGQKVEGIGNNVTLDFETMDFLSEGTSKLVISGRSPIDKNTIHIHFSGQSGETNQLVEFGYSEIYEERVFELEKITGLQNVTFIFLPGSHFDFNWFRFEH